MVSGAGQARTYQKPRGGRETVPQRERTRQRTGAPHKRRACHTSTVNQTTHGYGLQVHGVRIDDKSYGCHHSKVALIAYPDRLCVAIHTANAKAKDWNDLTQGVWTQDFPLKGQSIEQSNGSCEFEDILVSYLEATGWTGEGQCTPTALRAYDFSTARVHLVAAVPSTSYVSRGTSKKWGQGRLEALLAREPGGFDPCFSGGPVIIQNSSVGQTDDTWMRRLFKSCSSERASAAPGAPSTPLGTTETGTFVRPTNEEVQTSYTGYSSGTSIPGALKNVSEPHLRRCLARWSPRDGSLGPEGRARLSPHFKSVLRAHPSVEFLLAWCYLGSANLSKPAWGAYKGKGKPGGEYLAIQSFELGVLFVPSLLPPGTQIVTTAYTPPDAPGTRLRPGLLADRGLLVLPIPYALPCVPYDQKEMPWAWDAEKGVATPNLPVDYDGWGTDGQGRLVLLEQKQPQQSAGEVVTVE